MKRDLPVELTVLVMIKKAEQVLIQERTKSDWPGWTFPGGHVEKAESMEAAAIREIQEETGLTVQPKFIGVTEWLNDAESGEREVAGLFIAETQQEPTLATEGKLFWVSQNELTADKMAGTLGKLLPLFKGQEHYRFIDHSH